MNNRKQIKRFSSLLLLVGMLLTSCQKEVEPSFTPNGNVAAAFTSSIATGAQTKTSTDNTTGATHWTDGDEVGIYMLASGGHLNPDTPLQENVAYLVHPTDNASIANFNPKAASIYYPNDGAAVQFIAYYPYTDQVENHSLALDVSDQAQPAKIDVLYSSNQEDYSKTNPKVALTFSHVLSQLKIQIQTGGNLTAEDLIGMTVTLQGMPTKGSFSLADGTLSAETSTPDFPAITAANGSSASALLLPQNADAYPDRKVIFKLASGKSYTWEIPNEQALASGESYEVTITLTPTALSAGTITVDSWSVIKPNTHAYSVGDAYPDEINPIGVVFQVTGFDLTGSHGLIVGLDEELKKLAWSDTPVVTGATDQDNGWNNMQTIKALNPNLEQYPAFRWCADHTDGGLSWYLPALHELEALARQKKLVNQKLSILGKIITEGDYAWSSSEGAFDKGFATYMHDATSGWFRKTSGYRVRAIAAF